MYKDSAVWMRVAKGNKLISCCVHKSKDSDSDVTCESTIFLRAISNEAQPLETKHGFPRTRLNKIQIELVAVEAYDEGSAQTGTFVVVHGYILFFEVALI